MKLWDSTRPSARTDSKSFGGICKTKRWEKVGQAQGRVYLRLECPLRELKMGTSWHYWIHHSSIFYSCWAAHGKGQCFHFPPAEGRAIDWSASLPTWLSFLCLKPVCSLMLSSGAASQQWGWHCWAQGTSVKEDILLPFCTTGLWAQWMIWPLSSLFHFAFVSSIRDIVHPEVYSPCSSSIPVF